MHCINTIRASVKKLPGIIRTDVNPPEKRVSVVFEADQVSAEKIKASIEAAGYQVV